MLILSNFYCNIINKQLINSSVNYNRNYLNSKFLKQKLINFCFRNHCNTYSLILDKKDDRENLRNFKLSMILFRKIYKPSKFFSSILNSNKQFKIIYTKPLSFVKLKYDSRRRL